MTNNPQGSGNDGGGWVNIGKAGFQPTSQSPTPSLPTGSSAVSGVAPAPSVNANAPAPAPSGGNTTGGSKQ